MTASAVAPLPAQLAQVTEQLLYARERARTVSKGLDATTWTARPPTGGWSIGECLTHLNLTSEAYLPLIDVTIRDGRARGLTGPGPFGMGPVAWVLQRFLEPPYRIKTTTGAAFTPASLVIMDATLERFDALQREVQDRIDASAGLALDRLRVASPFDARVRYNLYAAFCLIATHQRRHLWQAEQVRAQLQVA